MMTYDEALTYLDSLTNYERVHQPTAMRAVRLERMQALCEQLGNPHKAFRSILVAGTNGKGSICAMIYEILRAANLRVGLYTSPHLEDIRERIRVHPEPPTSPAEWTDAADWISREDVATLVAHLREAVASLPEVFREDAPTYFEVLTAAALLHFRQRGVQLAVLEVGLGGRLDATNIVEQAASVIGPIGLDHTDVLGTDLVGVATEKAGILKSRQVVMSALQAPEVAELLRHRASDMGCRLLELGRHFSTQVRQHQRQGLELVVRTARGEYADLTLPLLGRHQADNAAVAIATVEALTESGMPRTAVQRGLARVRWPGRIELIQDEPTVLLDGAHNPQAAHALKATLEELWPQQPVHLLLGVSADKSVRAIGELLCPLAASVTCTRSRHPRACDPHQLARQLEPSTRALTVIPEAVDAYTYLVNTVGANDLIVVTGSLFLVGELRATIQKLQAQAPTRARLTASTKSEVT